MSAQVKDNKVYCYITESQPQQSGGVDNGGNGGTIFDGGGTLVPKTPQASASSIVPKTADGSKNSKASEILAMGDYLLSAEINRITSNVGAWTGNSNNQLRMNTAKQSVSVVRQGMQSPYMAMITSAMAVTYTAIDYSRELKFSKAESERKLIRAGYSSSGELVGRRH